MEDTNLDVDEMSVVSGTTDGSLTECLSGKDLHLLSCLHDAERVSPVFPCQDFNLSSTQHHKKTPSQDFRLSEENNTQDESQHSFRDLVLEVRPQRDENTDCCRREVWQSPAVKYLHSFRSLVDTVDITCKGFVNHVDCSVSLSAQICAGDPGADRYEGHNELTQCTPMCSSEFVVGNSSERFGRCGRGLDSLKVPSVARVQTTQKERCSSNLESVDLEQISVIGVAGMSLMLLGSVGEGEEMKSVANTACEGNDMKSVPNITSEDQEMKSVPNTTCTSEGQEMKSVPNTTCTSEGQEMKSVPNTTCTSEGQEMKSVHNRTCTSEDQEMKSVHNRTCTSEDQEMKSVAYTTCTSEGQDMKSIQNTSCTSEGQEMECVPNTTLINEGQDMKCVPNTTFTNEGQDMKPVANTSPCEVDIVNSVPNTSPNESPDIVITCSTASACVDLHNLVHTHRPVILDDAQVVGGQVVLDDSQRDLFESQALSEGGANAQLSITSPLIFDDDYKQKCEFDVRSCCSTKLRKFSDKGISSSNVQINCISQQAISSSDLQMEISGKGSSSLCPLNTTLSEQKLSSSDCQMTVSVQRNSSSYLQIKEVSEQGTRYSDVQIKDAPVRQVTSCSDIQVKDIFVHQEKSSSNLQVKEISVQQKTNSSDIQTNDTYHQEMNHCAEMFKFTSHSKLNMTTPKQPRHVLSSEKDELKETIASVKEAEDDNHSTASHSTLPPRESPQQSFQVKESMLPCTSLVSEREDGNKMQTDLIIVKTGGSEASSQDSKASSLLLNCPSLDGSGEAGRVGKVRSRHHFMDVTAAMKTSKAASHERKFQSVQASGQRQLQQSGMLKKALDGLGEAAPADSDLPADRTRHGDKHSLSVADKKIPTDAKTGVSKNGLLTDRMKVQSTGQPKVYSKELQRLVDLYDKMLDKVTSGRIVDGRGQLQKFEQIVHKLRVTHESYRARLLSSADRQGAAWQRQWRHMLDNQAMLAVAWDKHQLLEQMVQKVQADGQIIQHEGVSHHELQTSSSIGHQCSQQDSSSSLRKFSSAAKQCGTTGSGHGKDRSGAVSLHLCVSECQTVTKQEHAGRQKAGNSRVHVEGNSSRNVKTQRKRVTKSSETEHLTCASAAVVSNPSQTKAYQEEQQHLQCLHETSRMETQQPSSHFRGNVTLQLGSHVEGNFTLQPGSYSGENVTLQPGSHSGENVTLQPGSHIGENVTLQPGSHVGENVTLQPSSHSGENVTLQLGSPSGENVTLQLGSHSGKNVTLQGHSHVGENVILQAGSPSGENVISQAGSHDESDIEEHRVINANSYISEDVLSLHDDSDIDETVIKAVDDETKKTHSAVRVEMKNSHDSCAAGVDRGTVLPEACEMDSALACSEKWADGSGGKHLLQQDPRIESADCHSGKVQIISGQSPFETGSTTSQQEKVLSSRLLGQNAQNGQMSSALTSNRTAEVVMAGRTCLRKVTQRPQAEQLSVCLADIGVSGTDRVGQVHGVSETDRGGQVHGVSETDRGGQIHGVCETDRVGQIYGVRRTDRVGQIYGVCETDRVGQIYGVCETDRGGQIHGVSETDRGGQIHGVRRTDRVGQIYGVCETDRVGQIYGVCETDRGGQIHGVCETDRGGQIHGVCETDRVSDIQDTTSQSHSCKKSNSLGVVSSAVFKKMSGYFDGTEAGGEKAQSTIDRLPQQTPSSCLSDQHLPQTLAGNSLTGDAVGEANTALAHNVDNTPGIREVSNSVTGNTFQVVDERDTTVVDIGVTRNVLTKHAARQLTDSVTDNRFQVADDRDTTVVDVGVTHGVQCELATRQLTTRVTGNRFQVVDRVTTTTVDVGVTGKAHAEPATKTEPGTTTVHRIVPDTTTERRTVPGTSTRHRIVLGTTTEHRTVPCITDTKYRAVLDRTDSEHREIPGTAFSEHRAPLVPRTTSTEQRAPLVHSTIGCHLGGSSSATALDKGTLPKVVDSCKPEMFLAEGNPSLPANFLHGHGVIPHTVLTHMPDVPALQTSKPEVHKLDFSFPSMRNKPASPASTASSGLFHISSKQAARRMGTNVLEKLSLTSQNQVTQTSNINLHCQASAEAKPGTSSNFGLLSVNAKNLVTKTSSVEHPIMDSTTVPKQATYGVKQTVLNLATSSCQSQVTSHSLNQGARGRRGAVTSNCRKRGRPRNNNPAGNQGKKARSGHSHQGQMQHYFPLQFVTSGSGSATNSCTNHGSVTNSCTNHTSNSNSLPTFQAQISVNSNSGTRMDLTKEAPEFYPEINKITHLSTSEQSYRKSSVVVDVPTLIKNLRTVLLIADEEVTGTRKDFPSGFWEEDFTKIRVSESVWKCLGDW